MQVECGGKNLPCHTDPHYRSSVPVIWDKSRCNHTVNSRKSALAYPYVKNKVR